MWEEPGGARYNRVEDWTASENEYSESQKVEPREWKYGRLPKDVWQSQHKDELFSWSEVIIDFADVGDVCAQRAQIDNAELSIEHSSLQQPVKQKRLPRDPERLQKYHALLGKARKVSEKNPKQARYLRLQASALLECIDNEETIKQAHEVRLDQAEQLSLITFDVLSGCALAEASRGASQVYAAS